MKFGKQLHSGSYPEWKLNNIDYNKLKSDIKRVTTTGGKGGEGERPLVEEEERAKLENLYESFRLQFKNVNLFVGFKMREISGRLLTIESRIVQWSGREGEQVNAESVHVIKQQLRHCNLDLQRFSRYLILQKTSFRKLTKKFLKHYRDKKVAREFIGRLRNCAEVQEGYEGISFMSVDLDPYLMEVSLIVGVLYDVEMKMKRGLRFEDDERVQGTRGSFLKPITSCLMFDTLFYGKYQSPQKFLLAQHNADEVKFLLTTLGYQVVDDEGSVSSVHASNARHGREDHGPYGSSFSRILSMSSINSLHAINKGVPTMTRSNSTSQAQKGVASKATVLPQSKVEMFLLDERFLADEAHNRFPNLLLHGQGEATCALMCHVGGLRDHVITQNLPFSHVVQAILNRPVQETENFDSSPVDAMCLEYVKSHKLGLRDLTITSKRARFFVKREYTRKSHSYEAVYLVSVDEDVTVNGSFTLPHTFLEIRGLNNYDGPVGDRRNKKDPELSKLVDEMLQHRIMAFPLPLECTLWRLGYQLKNLKEETSQQDLTRILLDSISDCMVKDANIDSIFQVGTEKLSVLASPKTSAASTEVSTSTPQRIVETNMVSDSQASKLGQVTRYWNEFDDGESLLSREFYVDSERQDADAASAHGFIRFDRAFINSFYEYIRMINIVFAGGFKSVGNGRNVIGSIRAPPSRSENCESTLFPPSFERRSYATFGTQTTAESNNRAYYPAWNEQVMCSVESDLDSLYAYKHDEVVSIFYLATLLVSSITTGTTIGIMFSLFSIIGHDETEFDSTIYITTMVLGSLLISLVLSSFSLLLLFSRYNAAPWWHYTSCIIVFFLVTFCVCYGLVAICI